MKGSPRGAWGIYRYFFGSYPSRTATMIGLMVVAGVAEGFGVLTLIPVLNLAQGASGAEGKLGRMILRVVELTGLEPTLPVLLAFIVFTISIKAVMLLLANKQVGYTVAGVTRDLRLDLMRALFDVRWSYLGQRTIGQFANSVTSESQRSAAAYREACTVVASVIQMLAYVVVATLISWPVALVAAVAGVGLTLLSQFSFRKSRAAGQLQTSASRSLSSRLVDVLQGIKPLKAMGRQGLVWPLLEHETEALNRARRRQISAYQHLRSFQEPILTVLLAFGIFAALTFSTQSLADMLLLAFVFYRLITHVNTLQLRYQTMVVGESAFFALRNELELARRQREVSTGTRIPGRLRESVRYENVSFAYGDVPVLTGVSLEIPAGTFVAIHGESGSGKTTLVDLLVRLHEPDEGRILVDGIPVEELDLEAWRQTIGYVPQEMLLFNESVFKNVTLGDPRFSRKDAERALRLAGAWDFVQEKEGGLDHPIGERGGNLSGGQRQRIAIARALLGRPSLLILDEVTTALDPATETAICHTLGNLAGEVTILSISHQAAMRAVADIIYVMSDGRLEPVSERAATA